VEVEVEEVVEEKERWIRKDERCPAIEEKHHHEI